MTNTNIFTHELLQKLKTNITVHQVLNLTGMWDTKYKNLQNEIIAINDRAESLHETARCFENTYSKKDLKQKILDIFNKLDADKKNYGIADATKIEFEDTHDSTTVNLINTTIKEDLEMLELTDTTEIFKNKTDKITAMFLYKMKFIYDAHIREYLMETVQRKRDVKSLLRTFAEFYIDEELDENNLFAKLNNLMTGLKTVIMTVDKNISNLGEVLEAFDEVFSNYENQLNPDKVKTRRRNKKEKFVKNRTEENLNYAFRYVQDEVEVLSQRLENLQESLVVLLAKVKLNADAIKDKINSQRRVSARLNQK